MTLRVIIGQAKTLRDALAMAVGKFNEETEERREFKSAQHEVIIELDENTIFVDMHYFFIWFTVNTPKPVEPEHTYIGSTEIDPKDPNWLKKWEDLVTVKTVWDKDRFQYTPEKSPEGPGSIEIEKE